MSYSIISFASVSDMYIILNSCWYIYFQCFFGDFKTSWYSLPIFCISFSCSLTMRTNCLCLDRSKDRLLLLHDASLSFTGLTFIFSRSLHHVFTRVLYHFADSIKCFFKRDFQTYLDVFTRSWSACLA